MSAKMKALFVDALWLIPYLPPRPIPGDKVETEWASRERPGVFR
jgi:hypothetical protein